MTQRENVAIRNGQALICPKCKDLLKVGFILTVVESIILLLLVPFYWPLIGIV